jgi:hypothetical protein
MLPTPTVPPCISTDGIEQRLAIFDAHNGLIDLTQGGVQACKVMDAQFGLLALGDVEDR